MHNAFKDLAIALAAKHERAIEEEIKSLTWTRKDLTKKMMTDQRLVPPYLLQHIFSLDAYAKIINLVNTPKDPTEFTAADHIEALFDEAHSWAQDKDDLVTFFRTNGLLDNFETSKEELFNTVLLTALMMGEIADDQGSTNLPTDDTGRGPEPESA